MDELKDGVHGSKYFTKMDSKNGYHLIRIKEEDEWKTAPVHGRGGRPAPGFLLAKVAVCGALPAFRLALGRL